MSKRSAELPTFHEIATIAKTTFRRQFGQEPAVACCAPGRVNLIGEHLDYNDGFVLPMALPMVTLVLGNGRDDDEMEIVTCCSDIDQPTNIRMRLKEIQRTEKPKWANYVMGVVHGFLAQHRDIATGFNAVIVSNVPVGGGLSSSAALEVSMLTFLEELYSKKAASLQERALICQTAEHKFAGVPCGIMDQMIAVAGEKNHALLLDCRSLEMVQIPFLAEERGLAVLICNSNVKHELSHSEYPTRRKQCFEALRLMGLESYRDATEGNLSVLQVFAGPDDENVNGEGLQEAAEERALLLKRARHVINETKHTQEAAAALREHNFQKMGELMTKSHVSLRDDFEVSCPELDVLVEAAINCRGVLGSRMTGGGFGGCTVTLVHRDAVADAMDAMRTNFNRKFPKCGSDQPEESSSSSIQFYIGTPSDGARRVPLP